MGSVSLDLIAYINTGKKKGDVEIKRMSKKDLRLVALRLFKLSLL